jgi:alkylated DNA repair dioxygenase AlkB
MRRATAMYGRSFVTQGRKLTAAEPLPLPLLDVIKKAAPFCPADTLFDQCIVTKYPVGAGIGWHTDARCFGDCIVGISLGADSHLLFRRRGESAVGLDLLATPGSLYVISGAARWLYQHRIRPVKATRYSLTFREVG